MQVRELATRALATKPTHKAHDFLALLDPVEAHFDDRAAQWADADLRLRDHPTGALTPAVRNASTILVSLLLTLEFEAMRVRYFSTWLRPRSACTTATRAPPSTSAAAIAKACAEAVKRYPFVEVMGHPPEHYELRPMTLDHVGLEGIHNRRVQLENILPLILRRLTAGSTRRGRSDGEREGQQVRHVRQRSARQLLVTRLQRARDLAGYASDRH